MYALVTSSAISTDTLSILVSIISMRNPEIGKSMQENVILKISFQIIPAYNTM